MELLPTPEDKRRQDGLLITTVVMTAMAGIFVLLRCISRFLIIRTPGLDDYFIIGAMALTFGYLANLFILKQNHLGFPITMLTPDNMVTFIKVTLAIQVMYYANIFCIKTSICLTYLRFAVSKTFRVLCYGTIVVHSVFFVICIIVTLAQCRPLEKMWDLTNTVDGTCINTTAYFYSTSAFNIVTDIWILVLPFKTLRSVQRPTKEKVALFCIFGVGAFAAAASIVRLHTIYIYTLASDPFRDGVPVNLWSIIEVTIAISCASVSALKPIFSVKDRKGSGKFKWTSSSGANSGKTARYMQSGASNGPRQRARMASIDESSVKGVLTLESSNLAAEERGHEQESWAVPESLRQPPPRTVGTSGNAHWDDLELTFLQPDPEVNGTGEKRKT
ncbi:hypothetical protein B0T16DRAFT_321975 [Cercophora newfieldiana]|uniref:Rhodopsin domain-containing protein n=1 Tax=Cercophora newfieldiana TaxID=92897 RepID=A0AA39YJD7_9PEZI|nr:hypothetical protein B0T16DRAFT_321975 [Cercophora newfieldiana]